MRKRVNLLVARIRKKSLHELDLHTITQIVLSPEEQARFAEGIVLFNARKFWEAHEAWEEIWQHHPEDGRFFIQGLIQLAAGYHQLQRKIYRGFAIHLERAQTRLTLFPDTFLGIDVKGLRENVGHSLEEVKRQENLGEANLSGTIVPEIEVLR
jgi:uncharacterized protein